MEPWMVLCLLFEIPKPNIPHLFFLPVKCFSVTLCIVLMGLSASLKTASTIVLTSASGDAGAGVSDAMMLCSVPSDLVRSIVSAKSIPATKNSSKPVNFFIFSSSCLKNTFKYSIVQTGGGIDLGQEENKRRILRKNRGKVKFVLFV